MQSLSASLTIAVFLALIALLVAATAAPVEIVGTLQNVNGSSPPGKIAGIQEEPCWIFATYDAKEGGLFRFTGDSMGSLGLHGRSMDHPPTERVIAAGTTVSVTVPLGQDVQVRIVEAEGKAVAGSRLRIHHGDFKRFIH